MAEKDFQTELMRGLALAGGHAYKIPDMPFKLAQQARFVSKKPYDCFWLYEGAFWALELKQVSSGISFAMSNLRDHQEEALLEVERGGGNGLVVVNFRVRLSATQAKKRGTGMVDRAFAAHISQVVQARTQEARTGLPLEWWESYAYELPEVRTPAGKGWEPRVLVEGWQPVKAVA
ncbi:MAG: hypothetical protein ACH37Z_12350 [Anaerolineae bacterium]